MKRQIPNILTLLNLFSGCVACAMAFSGQFFFVFAWVVIAAVFDFFDGFAARMLGVSSPLGIQLDSLADVVSFGVAPATAVFVLLNYYLFDLGIVMGPWSLLPYFAFLLPMFAAYRLGKFNIDERQTTSFLGLPTPANGLFWVSFVYGMDHVVYDNRLLIVFTLVLIVAFSLLMVSELPMFSLKVKAMKVRGNERQLILILLMVIFVVLWGIAGIAWGIVSYVLLSLVARKKDKTFR